MTHRARARARARRWTRDTSTPFRHAFPSAYLFRDVSSVHVQAGGRGTPPPASPIPARTTPSRVTGTPASRACPPARNPRSRNRAPITGLASRRFSCSTANVENVENVENRRSVLRGARARFTRGLVRALPKRHLVEYDATVLYTLHAPTTDRRRTREHSNTARQCSRNLPSETSHPAVLHVHAHEAHLPRCLLYTSPSPRD